MTCAWCGDPVPDGAHFCHRCGQPSAQSTESAQPLPGPLESYGPPPSIGNVPPPSPQPMSQWVPPPPPPGFATPQMPPGASGATAVVPRGWSWALVGTLGFVILVALLAVLLSTPMSVLVDERYADLQAGEPMSVADALDGVVMPPALLVLVFVSGVASYIAFVGWLARSMALLPRLGIANPRYTARGTVWRMLVPVANAWWGLAALNDVIRAVNPPETVEVDPTAWRHRKVWVSARAWWVMIGFITLASNSWLTVFQAPVDIENASTGPQALASYEELAQAIGTVFTSSLIAVIAGAVGIGVIRRITRRQLVRVQPWVPPQNGR